MGIGQQRQGQFRFRADCVEARRIQYHQSFFQQRMREADHRVAPARYLDEIVRARLEAAFAGRIDREAELLGLFERNPLGFADTRQRTLEAGGGVRVERKGMPFVIETLQFCDGRVAGAGLDWQQADARPVARRPLQLGRAHRRTAGARWQDAVAIVTEEHCIDQFGLAAGEFGDESDRELILAQPVECVLESQFALGVAELIVVQPHPKTFDGGGGTFAPFAVGGEAVDQAHVRFRILGGCSRLRLWPMESKDNGFHGRRRRFLESRRPKVAMADERAKGPAQQR